MQKNNDILEELKELNSLLGAIPAQNVFTVPKGYFSSLSDKILGELKTRTESVPEGYFENLASSVMKRIKQEESTEEDERSFIDAVRFENVFMVPDGYFEKVSDNILGKIEIEGDGISDTSFIDSIKDKNVFEVPALYFETLSENIMSRLSENGAILSTISKENVYQVPDQYFEQLSGNIVKRIPAPAKVVTMRATSFFKYAVAACITGIISLSIFNAIDKQPANSGNVNNVVMAQAGQILKNNNFDEAMQSLGEDDILKYLESNGEDVEAAMVASLTDDKTLPVSQAYYFDDQVLDQYINELGVSKTSSN